MRAPSRPAADRPGRRGRTPAVLLYGRHAVLAALANPRRRKIRLLATPAAMKRLAATGVALPAGLAVTPADPARLAALVGDDAPHQGLVLEALPLPPGALADLAPDNGGRARVVVLDRVEDPRNVGAIMRSAALLGAKGIVTTARHAPAETGALAKAAAGALDVITWVRVPNLARALDELAGMGYWRVGLARGPGASPLDAVPRDVPLALVLGAEGSGLRPLTRRKLDWRVAIPMPGAGPLIDSLNVSVAAGIALWALRAAADEAA